MPGTYVTELISDGASQIVRIPAEFRLDSTSVEIRRDPATGTLILAPAGQRLTWDEFFDLVSTLNVPDEFMAERPMNQLPVERPIFEDR